MQLDTIAPSAHCCSCSPCGPSDQTPAIFFTELFVHYNSIYSKGIMPPQMQNYVELHEIALSSVLQSVENGSKATWCISHPSFFCITCGLTESTFFPIVYIIHVYCSSIDSWGALLGTGLQLIFVLLDHTALSFTIHPSIHPVCSLPHRPLL